MGQRLFKVLDKMNQDDTDNKTRNVAISNSFIRANKHKKGAEITMGMDEQSLQDIMEDKVIPIVVLIDREEYKKLNPGG